MHIRGQINGRIVSVTSSAGAFVLPESYRPASTRHFPVLTTNGANVIAPGRLSVASTGTVEIYVGGKRFASIELSSRP